MSKPENVVAAKSRNDPPINSKAPVEVSRMRRDVTAERLRELLEYAPETGLFYWRMARGSNPSGRVAGSIGPGGYQTICIDGVKHYAHRLAWLYTYGEHPAGEVDHINGDPKDARIANLRVCSRSQNARNVRPRSASGFKGAYFRPRRKAWYARIQVNGCRFYLGSFQTAQEAAAAYDCAARLHHSDFARTNHPAPPIDAEQREAPA
jgi:hypothetical protein